MTARRPRLAFWFRYGPGDHTELCHAIPAVIRTLSADMDIVFIGMRGVRPTPPEIERYARVEYLPFRVNRHSARDKWIKTLLWILILPWIALRCRWRGVDAVYMDETIPGSGWIARFFFGRRIALTVADQFLDIYFGNSAAGRALKALDAASWRRMDIIMTRARSTRDHLARLGVDPARVFPIYDPCDTDIYHPADRAAARAAYGYGTDEVVLVHHGILHPNKGLDRILDAVARSRAELPALRVLLIGDGPEMTRLRRQAADLRIEDLVRFTGWIEKMEDVNIALNAGDIGLVMRVGQTADHFHMTGALVHSMAVGLPVLAARLGGVSEVVEEDRNGLLFAPDRMDEFAQKLGRLVRDADLRRRLGAAALETARLSFDMNTVVRQTADMLRQLVRGGS